MLVQPSEAISVTYLLKSASTSPVANVSHTYQSGLCHSHTSFNSFVGNMRDHAFWELRMRVFIGRSPRHPRISRRSHYPRSKITQSSCILTENYLPGMTFSVTLCVVNHDTSHELCSTLKYVLVNDTHNNSVMSGQITYRFMIQSIVMTV